MLSEDTDECGNNNGGCNQTCTNTDGSFRCSCTSAYTLNSDGRSCSGKNYQLLNCNIYL